VDGRAPARAGISAISTRAGAASPIHYRLDDKIYNLSARRLNEYIAEYMGDEFTAKDFRTWGGTLVAAVALAEHAPAETPQEAKRVVAGVMRTVGERLGNTPAVARASYVSPAVVDQYSLLRSWRIRSARKAA
jgi:DNA topoisomerase I